MQLNVQGIDLRIVTGEKFRGDLRMDMWTGGRWVPVDMALPLAMVDFFAENEHARYPFMPHWRVNGDTYFLEECVQAAAIGWEPVAARIRRQRGVA